jgi:1,4-alpha-glucan branching enzyme
MKSTLVKLVLPEAPTSVCRLEVHKSTRLVNFVCRAPEAEEVQLVGDFNHWDPASHPMKHQVDGTWVIQVQLPHGYQHYRFLVDGKPTLDPRAYGIARDEFGEKVSLLGAG